MLTLMVGPSGAGKSTWLQHKGAELMGIRPSQIIGSDATRADLCGDFRDQSKNDEAFEAVHATAKARLKHGLPTVIDATHLRRKDRMAAAMLLPGTHRVRYIALNRSMAEKRRDAGWRAELSIDLIAKHEQTFKSQIVDILIGDGLANVEVHDFREFEGRAAA